MSPKDYHRLIRAVAIFGFLFVLTLCALIGQTIYYNTKFEKVNEYLVELRQYRQDVKDGVDGSRGDDGKDGFSIVGPTGPQGASGAQGNNGNNGNNGDSIVGPVGAQGPEGPQGATGPQGPQGRTVMCRTNILGQTECKYAGDSDWIPESEFN